MDVSGITLFSDIDGTLGLAGRGIPRRSAEAIRRFTQAGGRFALATGRWLTDVTPFVRGLPINAPSILNNGAALYDFGSGAFLYNRPLPDEAGQYARDILSDAGEVGLLAANESGYYWLTGAGRAARGLDFAAADWETLAQPYLKFLFLVPPERMETVCGRIARKEYPGVDFVRSSESSVEMVPAGVSKGAALAALCERTGLDLRRTAFIGDSYNDEEMFRRAGISACTADTPGDLAALCRVRVGRCMDGAVADFIEYLERL